MIQNIYTIYDTAASAFNTPFYMHNDGMAFRAFADNVNDEGSIINKHPEQFILFKLGSYDDSEAMFDLSDKPHPLCKGIELVDPEKKQYSNTDLNDVSKKLEEILKIVKPKPVFEPEVK
jgi:hypothetical protein